MKKRNIKFSLLFCGIFIFSSLTVNAQSDIKVNGSRINRLDKKKRKQGDWILFDSLGFVRLSCVFENDRCISPFIFYENGDTSFIRFQLKDSAEAFILYNGKSKHFGNFIHTSDSTTIIEIEPDSSLNDSVVLKIKEYQNIVIVPNYYFHQQKLIDYISASFTSSNFTFNKQLNILLTISIAGIVTDVEFPKNKNNLSGDEERELYRMYSTMPRWQPFFYRNRFEKMRILLSNNATLSIMSFDN